MGTLHGITQISPSFVGDGVALLCKKKFVNKVKAMASKIKKESYVDIQEAQINLSIINPNIDGSNFVDPEKKLYVIIQSGGKWGYGESFIKLIKELSPFLENAIFYLDHEGGPVEEFKITDGKLYHSIVAKEEDIDNFIYIEKAYTKNKSISQELYKHKLIAIYDDIRDEKEALKFANKAIKLNNQYWKFHHLKGCICIRIGKYPLAIRCFKQALKLAPDPGTLRITPQKDTPLAKTENNSLATDKKALQYNPFEVEFYWFEDAEKQVVLDYKNMYLNLGWAYKMLKQYDEVLIHYLKAEKIVPTYHDNTPLEYLSSYFIDVNKYDEAIEYCNKLVKRASSVKDIAIAYYNKACVYAKQKDTKKAIYFLTLAIELNPYKYKEHAKKDEDLKNINMLKAFQKLVE